jgi:hypothetical protein
MALKFLAFNESRLISTRAAWTQDAVDGLAFPSEIERLLAWVETHQEPSDHDAAAFGIFKEGTSTALAICEVAIQRKSVRSKWVKLLRLHLKPSVDDKLQAGHPEGAMDVFVQAIAGSLNLQVLHKANTLKVYGRTNDQLNFLKALEKHVSAKLTSEAKQGIKATIEGRFLSVVIS